MERRTHSVDISDLLTLNASGMGDGEEAAVEEEAGAEQPAEQASFQFRGRVESSLVFRGRGRRLRQESENRTGGRVPKMPLVDRRKKVRM